MVVCGNRDAVIVCPWGSFVVFVREAEAQGGVGVEDGAEFQNGICRKISQGYHRRHAFRQIISPPYNKASNYVANRKSLHIDG